MSEENDNNDKYVALIPLRGGSKGLPDKNVRHLCGAPLYLRSVDQGLRVIKEVIITTDIEQVIGSRFSENVTVCSRPQCLSGDDTPMASVIEHVIKENKIQDKVIVLLQATSPLRSDEDIEAAISLYEKCQHDLVLSVTRKDSGVLKFGVLEGDDFVALRDPRYCFMNRQSLPQVFSPNGAVYVFSAKSFLSCNDFPVDRIGVVVMPKDRSFDIDSLDDFNSIEKILNEKPSEQGL